MENKAEQKRKNYGRRIYLGNSIKCNNIHIMGVPKEEKEKGEEHLFQEIIAGNFPN